MARDGVSVGKRKSSSKKVKVRRKSEDKPEQRFEKRVNIDKPRAFHAQVDRISEILRG